MSQPFLTSSSRIRRTPFSRRVEASGVKAYTTYNHTLLPTVFRSVEEDYANLKTAVQIWDVSCERQVEIVGPDARRLVAMTTPRDLGRMADDQCYYIPMVDDEGAMLNDPVLIKLSDDRYWVSLADTDMLYYYKGLATGFEIYLDGTKHGEAMWDMLFEAGKDLDVHAGCPNGIERIEGGLLSFGNDMNMDHTPFEAGLGKYCHLDTATDCLGHAALLNAQSPPRQVRPVEIDGPAVPGVQHLWPLKSRDGAPAGSISSAMWSPDFKTNVAIAMVNQDHWTAGTQLTVDAPDGVRTATVKEKFWI